MELIGYLGLNCLSLEVVEELLLLVDWVSSKVVISDDVSSVLKLVVMLVAGELGEDSCYWSSCTGTRCSTSVVVCGWLMVVRCARTCLRLVVVCTVVVQVGFCPAGLVRNLWHAAGIGFAADGLEMVVFMFESGCVVANGPGMFEFMLESGCSTVDDGLGMFEFMWESAVQLWIVLEWGYVMGICVGNCGGNSCLVTQ